MNSAPEDDVKPCEQSAAAKKEQNNVWAVRIFRYSDPCQMGGFK